jgi:antirestriction protein
MTETTPRIYVASLSDYNAGTLHGRWVDVDTDAAGLYEQIREMLEQSPEAKLCFYCGKGADDHGGNYGEPHAFQPGVAEEWAIHDYEGFGPWKPSEYASMETIAAVAAAIEEYGQAVLYWIDNLGGDVEEAIESFQDHYCGEHKSAEDYVADLYEETGQISDDHPLFNYIDWASVARDFGFEGYVFVEVDYETVYVFSP